MFTRPRRRSLLSLGLAAFALVASSTTPAHADSQFFKNSTFNGCYVEFPSSQGTQNPDNCLDIGNQVECNEGGNRYNEYISCDVRDSSCHWSSHIHEIPESGGRPVLRRRRVQLLDPGPSHPLRRCPRR